MLVSLLAHAWWMATDGTRMRWLDPIEEYMIEEIYAQSIQEGVRESVRGSLREWGRVADSWR